MLHTMSVKVSYFCKLSFVSRRYCIQRHLLVKPFALELSLEYAISFGAIVTYVAQKEFNFHRCEDLKIESDC